MRQSQHVFITGGASGIGLQLARELVRAGHDVSLFDRQATDLALSDLAALSALDALTGRQQTVRAFMLDVTNEASVAEAFAEAARQRRPDKIIHCAGITLAQPFCETPAETFDAVVRVNLTGSRNVAAQALKHLAAGGHLVLFASMAGLVGCYGYAAYSASKYGVVGLAEVLRIELAPRNIAVSVVCPPEVETPMVVEERRHRPRETETLKLLAGSLPLPQAATEILAGITNRQFLIIPGRKARLMWRCSRWLPSRLTQAFTDLLIRLTQKRKPS